MMKKTVKNNVNVMTGNQYVFGLKDGFYSSETIGNVDAPLYTLVGSTIDNNLDFGPDDDLTGRHIIPNIAFRG
jgi:hypothetical protein